MNEDDNIIKIQSIPKDNSIQTSNSQNLNLIQPNQKNTTLFEMDTKPDQEIPSTSTKKSVEDTLFLNYFEALDLQQKVEENSEEVADKLNKFLTNNTCNEILFVNYNKPMPTRFSQNMDNIVAKLQESGAELLVDEYPSGISSESDSEESDTGVLTEHAFSLQETSTNINQINHTNENPEVSSRNQTTIKPYNKSLKGCLNKSAERKIGINSRRKIIKTKIENVKSRQNLRNKRTLKSNQTKLSRHFTSVDDTLSTKLINGSVKNCSKLSINKQNHSTSAKCTKKTIFKVLGDLNNSSSSKANRNNINVNNNNYDKNSPQKSIELQSTRKKLVTFKIKEKTPSKVSCPNNAKLEIIENVKKKLLLENTRSLRNSKNKLKNDESKSAKALSVKQNANKPLKSSKKIKSNNQVKRKIKREKYLSTREIETVKKSFKRLKENKSILYSDFLKTQKQIVEIKKSEILCLTQETGARYLPRTHRNLVRLRRLRERLKLAKQKENTIFKAKESTLNTPIQNVEVVNTCRLPRKKLLNIVSYDLIDSRKRRLEKEKYRKEMVNLEFEPIIKNCTKKIDVLDHIKIPKVPTYSYRKNIKPANVKRYSNRKKQEIKNLTLKRPYKTKLKFASVKGLKDMEHELDKQTEKKSVLNLNRPLEDKDILIYKEKIAKAMEKQIPQTTLKREILSVVELDPLYNDHCDVQDALTTVSVSSEMKKKREKSTTMQIKKETGGSIALPSYNHTKTPQILLNFTLPGSKGEENEFIQSVQTDNESVRYSSQYKTRWEETEFIQTVQSDNESDRYSPLYDAEDEFQPRIIPDAPFLSRDPAMLQRDDYDDDVISTPLHTSYVEQEEDILLSLSSGYAAVFKSKSDPLNECQDTIKMSIDIEETADSSQEDNESSYSLHVMEPVILSPVQIEIIQDSGDNPEKSVLNKESTLSAKIIRRAPIYQDAAKEEIHMYELDSTVPSDDIFLSRDPPMLQEDENHDPYKFEEEDSIEDDIIEDSDVLSGLQRVIHNPKKKTCDKNGDKKAKSPTLFPCSRCLYIGANVHNLERHMLIHMDPKDIVWHQCDLCPYKTKYKYALKGHADTHKEENSAKIFSCHLCNYKAHRKQNLNKHIYSAHNIAKEEEVYQCYDCGKQFNLKVKLTNHINNVHSISCEKCQFCNFVTVNKVTLGAHIRTKHTEPERLYFCQQCTFKSKFPRDLDKHILRMHNRDQMKKYDCVKCPFSTIYKSNMRYHMTHVHNSKLDEKVLRQFICGHCMKVCNNKMALKAHILQRHMKLPDEDYFKCEKCTYKTKVVRNLKRHVFLKHEQQGTKCKKCDFTTTRTTSMIAHMVAHKKEENSKIYRCNECVYIAYTLSTMTYHMKKFHNKIVSCAELKDYLK